MNYNREIDARLKKLHVNTQNQEINNQNVKLKIIYQKIK